MGSAPASLADNPFLITLLLENANDNLPPNRNEP